MELQLTLTYHDPETGYHRLEFELVTGRYALTLVRSGSLALLPVFQGSVPPKLTANPHRLSGLMRAWTPLSSDFAAEFEEHLLRHNLDPLSTELLVSAVRDAARRARESVKA